MTDLKKPFIFLSPLTEPLRKLKEVADEILSREDLTQEEIDSGVEVEEKNFEVFEAESSAEVDQLIPTVGPSLTIVASPKRCALMLKNNIKYLKIYKSKVILLSPKEISHKVITKLTKLGLTEYMVEPINPKTLLYKVKFLLKSLPDLEKVEEEKEKKSDKIVFKKSEDEIKATDHDKAVQRVEKGVIGEELGADLEKRKEDRSIDLMFEDDPKKKKTSAYDLSLFDEPNSKKRKSDVDLLLIDEEKVNSKNKDENQNYNKIEKYYKTGNRKKDIELNLEKAKKKSIDEDDLEMYAKDDGFLKARDEIELSIIENKKLKEESTYEEEQVGQVTKLKKMDEINLDIEAKKNKIEEESDEEDIKLEKKKKKSIELDIEGKKLSPKSDEDDFDEDEEVRKAKKEMLELDLTLEKKRSLEDELEEATEELNKKSRKKKEDIELNIEKAKRKLDEEELEEEVKQKNKKELELDIESAKKKLKDKKAIIELDITKARKSLEDKSLELEDKSSSKKDKKKVIELELEKARKKLNEEELTEAEKALKLLEEDDITIDLEEASKKKKKEDIELQLDAAKRKKLDDEEEDESSNSKSKLKKDEIELKLESSNKKSLNEDELNDNDFMKMKKINDIDLNLEDENGKIKNHGVDHISTYYGLKKVSKSEKGADWDITPEKENVLDFRKKKKKQKVENLDLKSERVKKGQTIDYRKMREQFDIIGQIATKRKSYKDGNSNLNLSEDPDVQAMIQRLNEISDEKIDIDAIDQVEEDELNKSVFEPNSKGMEYVIETEMLYNEKTGKAEDILKFLGKTINKELKGITTFFSYDNNANITKEEWCGHLELDYHLDEDEKEEEWKDIKFQRIDAWKVIKLPTWSDNTFQDEKIEFFYPFTEGDARLGFAVVHFMTKFDETEAKKLEVILESARGIYLETFHAKGGYGEYSGTQKDVKEKKSVFGFLKRGAS